ncbi:hypothetical protein GYMLUDRAFT_252124 [Collybiopsis luxurians FD-317 M1]|uniref:F-box domain-containing protein n=1 Tax=Collybiopsis luxurians FD-317 M1 TaxID=944289 RepID=A0A0D0C956_9AGAR|nr:hypothetical protein GYMLUDRAFT_252124 [Collybiopsis luxurians FD-317 M1]
MLKSVDNSFGELAQYTVSCIDELTQNLGIYDNGPTFDRLCQGHFASQLSEVNPFLGDAGIHLAGYDRSISLIEEALLKLKSARAGLKRSVNVALSLCAPIRRLPKDILVEIFVIYTEESWPNRWLFLGKRRDYFVTLTSEDWGSGPEDRYLDYNLTHTYASSRERLHKLDQNQGFVNSVGQDLAYK